MPGSRRGNLTSVESLEPRALLAARQYDFVVRLYHDADTDGRRDAREPWLARVNVEVKHHDARGGRTRTMVQTNGNGRAYFTVWGSDRDPAANFFFLLPRDTRYFPSDVAARHGHYAVNDSDFVEGVLTLAMIDHGRLTGKVRHVFPSARAPFDVRGLFGARVFADYDNDGVRDAGEASVVTATDGTYTMKARFGRYPVRIEPRSGWRRPAGKSDSAMITHKLELIDGTTAPPLYTQVSRPVVIDVLALHEHFARGIGAAFDTANHVLANSNANAFLRLVGTEQVAPPPRPPGQPAMSLREALDRLRAADDGFLDGAHAKRDAAGADLVVLFLPKWRTAADGFVGYAYEFNDRTRDSDLGFSVVTHSTERGAPDPEETFIHEIGHNLGAGHDPGAPDEADDSAATTAPAYAHGYRLGDGFGSVVGDVMSYNVERVLPAFSTPHISVGRKPKPMGDPRSADNARRVREVAPLVSAYRRAPAAPPTRGFVSRRPAASPSEAWPPRWHGPLADLPESL